MAYAAAIKGLMEADSGLREWQIGAINRKSKFLLLQVEDQSLILFTCLGSWHDNKTSKG